MTPRSPLSLRGATRRTTARLGSRALLCGVAVVAALLCFAVLAAAHEVTVHASAGASTRAELAAMSVAQLRRFLAEREAPCVGCLARQDLVERAVAVASWRTIEDKVASELVAASVSAVSHLTVDHLVSVPPEVRRQQAEEQQRAQQAATQFLCQAPLANGTVNCHSVAALQRHAQTM